MNLTLSNAIFKVEDLLVGKSNQKKLSEQEIYVLNFVMSWYSNIRTWSFTTSGSTGEPKKIELSKNQLAYSAYQTIEYLFDVQYQKMLFLLCLDPSFIGGTQVITRALIAKADLMVIPPASNPIKSLTERVDLISLVPMQIETILRETPEKFNLIKNVLIGGAELSPNLINQLQTMNSTRFYQTYGMTETASHVAIKSIDEDDYSVLGDVEIAKDERGCLKVRGRVTNHFWIQTNDLVDIQNGKFQWLCRVDWVINSGGVKLSPERIERKLSEHWPDQMLMITSVLNDRLGEKIVLILQKPLLNEIKKSSILSRFEMPKDEIIIPDWLLNKGGKIDRKRIQQWVRGLEDHSQLP